MDKIFVNLPVKNLDKTKEFFSKLGFTFNAQFTDDKAACMVISDNIYSMLLKEDFFKSFIPDRQVCDSAKEKEVLIALSVESRGKVDELMGKALNAGGREARPAQDYGWMYGRAFEDIDGHIWELFYMDEKARPVQ